MKKQIFLASLCAAVLSGASVAQAQSQFQRECGLDIIRKNLQAKDPEQWEQLRAAHEATIAQALSAPPANNALFRTTGAAAKVPVVFHLILTQAQLNRIGGVAGVEQRLDSQIAVLNRDYNRGNSDSTLIPAAFKSLYGNPGIQFGLALTDPSGHGAKGYELKVLPAGADSTFDTETGTVGSTVIVSDCKYNGPKGLAPWDNTKYLNVWIVNITSGGQSGVLGITVPPSFVGANYNGHIIPASEKGIVVTYDAFGKRKNTLDHYFQNVIDKGRTLTHEVGHYFEIWHVWGDDQGLCPNNGGSDDGIADTPPQADQHFGTPSFPQISCNNGPNGDMFMNYMDYVDDGAMHLFTQDQAQVMANNAFNGESTSLTSNPALTQWPQSVSEVAYSNNMVIAPNPSTGYFTISFSSAPQGLRNISVRNSVGQVVRLIDGKAGNNGIYNVDLSGMSKGIYFVQCLFDGASRTEKIVLQ